MQDLCKVRQLITCNRVVMQVDDVRRSESHRVAASVPRHLTPAGWTLLVPDPLRHAPRRLPNKGHKCTPKCAPPKLRNFAGSAVAAKVSFGGHSAAAYPALSRLDIRGHSAAAKVTLAAEAQPAKLRKVGGYHLGANDEHAAVLTPPKLRNIGGSRAGRQNSGQNSGFAACVQKHPAPPRDPPP